MAVRLVVADDHPVVLTGIVGILRAAADLTVVEACDNGEAALRAIRRHRPDVALLEMRLSRLSGFDVVREIRREGWPTRVVLLTAQIDEEQTLEAMRERVHGVILKDMTPRLLVTCVRKVASGGHWIEWESLWRAADRLVRRQASRDEGDLTPSEQRILELVAGGRANRQIAEMLRVSEGTVKSHLHNIYTKLEVANRRDLVKRAKEKGLI